MRASQRKWLKIGLSMTKPLPIHPNPTSRPLHGADKQPPQSAFTEEARVGIAAVERDTGLGKDTLRVWERRYGFPTPQRDARGERVYSVQQVQRLRLIKRLMDAGHRPGALVPLDEQALMALPPDPHGRRKRASAESAGLNSASTPATPDMADWLALIRRHQSHELRTVMAQSIDTLGLAQFVTEVIAPLNVAVGQNWADGKLEIFEEHLYTESVQAVLRQSMARHTPSHVKMAPRVLLTTPPGETHVLGLLMAEAFFTLENCECMSMGGQMPLPDVAKACSRLGADIVAIGFSPAHNPKQAKASLEELRSRLAVTTELWAGGLPQALQRHPVRGRTRVYWPVLDVHDITAGVARWRLEHTES